MTHKDGQRIERDGFVLSIVPDVPFRLHQCYEPPDDTTLCGCAKCGTTRLEVGYGHYYTVIRCPDCGHEICIHDG